MLEIQPGKVPYKLRLTLTEVEQEPLTMLSISSFLYNLLVLHDRLILLSSRYDYAYDSSWWFYGRQARKRIKKADRLQVDLITRKSPFIIEVLIPAAGVIGISLGSIWTFIQILEKLRDWDDDKAIKQLTRKHLESDVIGRSPQRQLDELPPKKIEQEDDEFLTIEQEEVEEKIEDTIMKDTKRISDNEQLKITRVEILEYTEKQGED